MENFFQPAVELIFLADKKEAGLINLNEQMEHARVSSLDLIKVNCPLEVHSN